MQDTYTMDEFTAMIDANAELQGVKVHQ